MILVDTSVWIDHLHRNDPQLTRLLDDSLVAQHPFIVGELALGTLRNRSQLIDLLQNLPAVPIASSAEVLHLVERHRLHGQGLSLVDVHLLASVRLAPGATLHTRDKRLAAVAQRMGCAHTE